MKNKESIKNLERLRKKISGIFSVVLIVIIWIIQTGFLSYKYETNEIKDKKRGLVLIKNIEKRIRDKIEYNKKNRKEHFKNAPWPITFDNALKRVRLNNSIIFDRKWNVINSSFSDETDAFFQQKVNELWKSWRITIWDDEFIYVRIITPEGISFLNIERSYYTSQDYRTDILKVMLLLLILGIWIYYLVLRFSAKLFLPVEKNLIDMSNFIDNAGHELKTPLAVINWELQIMQATKKYDEELVKEWLREVENMNNLIEWLITLTWVEWTQTKEKIDVNNKLSEIIKEYSNKAKEKNIKLEISVIENFITTSNQNYFHILFSNLISNAIRYTKEWWSIKLVINKNKVSICDTGIWISPEDLKMIFNRFYRCDKSRNTEWFGIWLSLVKKVADINWWKISVTSEEWIWSIFKVNFK